MCKIYKTIKPGVMDSNDIKMLFDLAKKKNFAIPAINCINTDSINAVLETASKINSPVIIQFSYNGSAFLSGLEFKKKNKTHIPSVLGAISGAKHIHLVAKEYNIPVIIHTDHCYKEILPWINLLLEEGKNFFKENRKPLFSSHMIDLSKQNIKENVDTSIKYLKKITSLNMILELELGCTGGEEDGIDNTNINKKLLYTDPKDVYYAYKKLNKISNNFIIAASFGNVHGVYKSGQVSLKPNILKKSQKYVEKMENVSKNPLNFVFHGGSGSKDKEIQESIKYGIIKLNIDTDIQWSSWKGVLKYYLSNNKYLQNQLGNPYGDHQPNKKYYDPRNWIRSSKKSTYKYLKSIFIKLNACNILKYFE